MKTTVTQVESDCRELDVFIGADWAGRPALSVTDAAAYVSGAARRDRDHDVAWRSHLASSEAWELQRETVRRMAFEDAYEVSLRQGRGAAAAAAAGHEAARVAMGDFERKSAPPEFNGKETSPRWLTQATKRIKEVVR